MVVYDFDGERAHQHAGSEFVNYVEKISDEKWECKLW